MMPGDYHILAQIHGEIELGAFAAYVTPRLLDFALRNQWMGRQIIDLGCGTGESLHWLARHGYILTGVDQSPEMLQHAQTTLSTQGLSVRLLTQSILDTDNISDMDMVLSLDTLHEMNNLRELGDVFKLVHGMLKPDRLFVFDIYTVAGLVERAEQGDVYEYDNNKLTIFTRNQIDFERQVQTRDYIVFRRNADSWQRLDAQRILRAYPIQGVTALLNRNGFDIAHVLNVDFSDYQQGENTTRVIIMAKKRPV